MVEPCNDEEERLAAAARASAKIAALAAYFRRLAASGSWPSDEALGRMMLISQWVAFAVKTDQDPEDVISDLAGCLEEGAQTIGPTYVALLAGWARH